MYVRMYIYIYIYIYVVCICIAHVCITLDHTVDKQGFQHRGAEDGPLGPSPATFSVSEFRGVRVQGSGFRVQGSGFRV